MAAVQATTDHFRIVDGNSDDCFSSFIVLVLILSAIYLTLTNAFSCNDNDSYYNYWMEYFTGKSGKTYRRREHFTGIEDDERCDPNTDYSHSTNVHCRMKYLQKVHGVELFGGDNRIDFGTQEELVTHYLSGPFPAFSPKIKKIVVTDTQSFQQMLNLAHKNLTDAATLKNNVDFMNTYITRAIPSQNTTMFDTNLGSLITIMTIASILLKMYSSLCERHFNAYIAEIDAVNKGANVSMKTTVLYMICLYVIPITTYLNKCIHDLYTEFTMHTSTDKPKIVDISKVSDTVRKQLSTDTQKQLLQISDTKAHDKINAQTNEFMNNITSILGSSSLDNTGLLTLAFDSYITMMLQVLSDTYTYVIQLSHTASTATTNQNNVATLLSYDIINIASNACKYIQNMSVTLINQAEHIPISTTTNVVVPPPPMIPPPPVQPAQQPVPASIQVQQGLVGTPISTPTTLAPLQYTTPPAVMPTQSPVPTLTSAQFTDLISMPLTQFDSNGVKYAIMNVISQITTQAVLNQLASYGVQGTIGSVFAQIFTTKPELLNTMTIEQTRIALMNYFLTMTDTYWSNIIKPQASFQFLPNTTGTGNVEGFQQKFKVGQCMSECAQKGKEQARQAYCASRAPRRRPDSSSSGSNDGYYETFTSGTVTGTDVSINNKNRNNTAYVPALDFQYAQLQPMSNKASFDLRGTPDLQLSSAPVSSLPGRIVT